MAIERRELGAGLVGGLVGAVVLAVVLTVGGSSLAGVGEAIGSPSFGIGSGVLLGTSLLFGAAFAAVVTRFVDRYISVVLGITSRSELAKGVVLPLTQRFGMGRVVTTAMGLLYGLVLGIAVGWVILPIRTQAVGVFDPVWLLGYLCFGLVLGGTYGLIVME